MRLESALYATKAGIDAHGIALGVIGDNIANTNTSGFKSSRVDFASIVKEGRDGRQSSALLSEGSGVSASDIKVSFNGGDIVPTERTLDAGITGSGMFIVQDENEDVFYTRAGNFEIGSDGLLKTSNGLNVLGIVGTSTDLSTIDLQNVSVSATQTSAITAVGNLDSSVETTTVPTNPSTFKEINSAANFTTEISNVVDSLGETHSVILAFYKTDTNAWTAQAYIDGGEVGQTEGVPVQLGSNATLTFSNTGAIDDANKASASITATPAYGNGAAQGNFTIDLSSFTQIASVSEIKSITQDGQTTGNIVGYEIESGGKVLAVLDSDERAQVATLQLARFVNMDGLERIGDTLFRAGENVGDRTVGTPGENGFGDVKGSSLERSNVDISKEFVDLVIIQRGYQANSQLLNVTGNLIQQTLSLIR